MTESSLFNRSRGHKRSIARCLVLLALLLGTAAAWLRSYSRQEFFVWDKGSEDTASATLSHRYLAAGMSRGGIMIGATSRTYSGMSSHSWNSLVPVPHDGFNLISLPQPWVFVTRSDRGWVSSTLGVDASWNIAPNGQMLPIDLANDWTSTILLGCHAIATSLGGDTYNFSLLIPFWAILLVQLFVAAYLLSRGRASRRRGFDVAAAVSQGSAQT